MTFHTGFITTFVWFLLKNSSATKTFVLNHSFIEELFLRSNRFGSGSPPKDLSISIA